MKTVIDRPVNTLVNQDVEVIQNFLRLDLNMYLGAQNLIP